MVYLPQKQKIQDSLNHCFKELEEIDTRKAELWNTIFELRKHLKENIQTVNLFNLQQYQVKQNDTSNL